MVNYVTLSPAQQDRATELCEILDSETDVTPADLLDSWKPAPETQHSNWYTETRWVSTEDVVGTVSMNVDRFVSARALNT